MRTLSEDQQQRYTESISRSYLRRRPQRRPFRPLLKTHSQGFSKRSSADEVLRGQLASRKKYLAEKVSRRKAHLEKDLDRYPLRHHFIHRTHNGRTQRRLRAPHKRRLLCLTSHRARNSNPTITALPSHSTIASSPHSSLQHPTHLSPRHRPE